MSTIANQAGARRVPGASTRRLGGREVARKELPEVSGRLLKWFSWYSRGYLRRHFRTVRVSKEGEPRVSLKPLVLYLNHASWWDPLVCLALKEQFFPERKAFAPIDAAALDRYRFFRKIGFFGVRRGEWGGAAEFLRMSLEILREPGAMLVITPQGRFADVRERPARFSPGLGHLAARLEEAVFVPLAVEYVFWEERLPEILTRFGEPICVGGGQSPTADAGKWTAILEERLAATQDELAAESRLRRVENFRTLFRGGAGQGGVYDWWRRFRAGWNGETFKPEHGIK